MANPGEPLDLQFPQIYKEWDQAGGRLNNFRAHLLGIGTLTPVEADITFLLSQANAAIAELQNAQTKLKPPLSVTWRGLLVGNPTPTG